MSKKSGNSIYSDMRYYIDRESITGTPTHWKVSNFGMAQFKHNYDEKLLSTILRKALAIKEEAAIKRHLNLKYIRGPQRLIPEINQLNHDPVRLARINQLVGTELEPYPISIVASTITFMGPEDSDGTIDWHSDGVPVTELVPLSIEDNDDCGLEIYKGNHETGHALLAEGKDIPSDQVFRVQHRVGCSSLGQFIRVLHRTSPMSRGTRVTLVLNLRSREKPFVDDNSLYYLGADNPDFSWVDEVVNDVREHQLPAYEAAMDIAADAPKSTWAEETVNDLRASRLPAFENRMGIQ